MNRPTGDLSPGISFGLTCTRCFWESFKLAENRSAHWRLIDCLLQLDRKEFTRQELNSVISASRLANKYPLVDTLLRDLHIDGYIVLRDQKGNTLSNNKNDLAKADIGIRTNIVLTEKFYASIRAYIDLLLSLLAIEESFHNLSELETLELMRSVFTFQVTAHNGAWTEFIRRLGHACNTAQSEFMPRVVESSEHWLILHSIWISHFGDRFRKGASGDDLRHILTSRFQTHVLAKNMDEELAFLASEPGLLEETEPRKYLIRNEFLPIFESFDNECLALRDRLINRLIAVLKEVRAR